MIAHSCGLYLPSVALYLICVSVQHEKHVQMNVLQCVFLGDPAGAMMIASYAERHSRHTEPHWTLSLVCLQFTIQTITRALMGKRAGLSCPKPLSRLGKKTERKRFQGITLEWHTLVVFLSKKQACFNKSKGREVLKSHNCAVCGNGLPFVLW